ncbi:MAG TPA: hypothetical protein DHN29_01290 [Cytophagales bacterium]|nr:hypothetical protein [Cytophagales bacterium]
MRKTLLLFLVGLLLLNRSFAQVIVESNLPVSIGSGLEVQVDNRLSVQSTLTNEGTLYFRDSLVLTSYLGSGSILANGTDQEVYPNGNTINSFEAIGGTKSLNGSLSVNSLVLSSAHLKVDTSRLTVSGDISGFGPDSYIIGSLTRGGSDSLYFPIGDESLYTPVVLTSIIGTNPVLEVSLVNNNPAANAGKGLLSVSDLRYWRVSESSGSLDEMLVQLPTLNETVASSIAETTVAQGTLVGGGFKGLGASSTTGTLADGTVRSSVPTGSGLFAIGQYFDENLRTLDSLALVQIYESTNGAAWSGSSGWLTTDLNLWDRITFQNKRVATLNLASNNLSGEFPQLDTGLESLIDLNLSRNSLSDIGDLSNLTSLQSVDVSNNNLEFGSLEGVLAVSPGAIYSPQKEVLTRVRSLESIGSTYTVDRTVTGSANSYTWIKNGSAIAQTSPSFDVTINDFTADGTYLARVTNTNVPGLTLTTAPVVLRVSSLERDSASLMVIYDSLQGNNSTLSDWPNLPIAQWSEVIIMNSRVTNIDLSDKGLIGTIPEDVIDIQSMLTADFSDNDIDGIPDITGTLPNMTGFNVSGNKLTFEDLEPNAGVTNLNYADQQRFGVVVEDTIPVGSTVDLSQTIGGNFNQYQWYRSNHQSTDQAVGGLTSSELLIDSLNYDNMGRYELRVINSVVPNLILRSEYQTALASADLKFIALDLGGEPFTAGEGYALQVTEPGSPYDTVQIIRGEGNGFEFNDLILGDYLIAVAPDNLLEFLPTYYESTDLWREADTLLLRESLLDTLEMARIPVEGGGTAQVSGTAESDFEETSGRINARRKVKRAGCSVRRFVPKGRTSQDDEEGTYELYAYVQSDDEGRFEFTNLEDGTYRFNIEYPGIPMDEDSYVEFTIGEGGIEDEVLILEATVTDDGIVVQKIERLGFYRKYFKDLNVYPNPANSYVNIAYSKLMSETVVVRLIDLQGNVVTEQQIEKGYDKELQLDVSGISGGIYLLNFIDSREGAEKITTFKVVVSH